MKINYEVIKTDLVDEVICKTDKNGKQFWIPINPANSDYQAYLRWLENPEAEDFTPNLAP